MASRLSVLLVTDDPHLREIAEYGFPEDVDVTMVVDSHDALAAMKERIPNVVVVDLQTGSAGGFNLLMEMHEDSLTRAVPTLLLLERSQDEWLAKQAGAAAIRVKPLGTSEFVAETLSAAKSAKSP